MLAMNRNLALCELHRRTTSHRGVLQLHKRYPAGHPRLKRKLEGRYVARFMLLVATMLQHARPVLVAPLTLYNVRLRSTPQKGAILHGLRKRRMISHLSLKNKLDDS